MLRHAPEKYSLHLDREGWTDIASIMMALKQSRTEWAELGESDLLEVLTWASNTRFEVREGIIKHSRDWNAQEFPQIAEYGLGQRPPLEAQIIDLADEIAYTTADFDDGLDVRDPRRDVRLGR